ncbi:MAG TPA: hypothetical protein VHF58_10310 [Solirubrobacterales bacterium]|nr:hypothetical protein [Solirubrobacterales bacterium]
MPYARFNEFEPSEDRSTPTYDGVHAELNVEQDPPAGLIFHSAGFGENGAFRIYEVWETREQAEEFLNERIMPAVNKVTEGDPSPPATQELYELHNFIRGR